MSTQPLVVKSSTVPPLQVLGTQVRFLCEGASTGNAWSLMEVTLPQGSGPPAHVHRWDEAYFVLEGEVAFTVGERRIDASAGDFIYTPGGLAHGFSGASQQPAKLLVFDAPAHAGRFFKRVDREVKAMPGDLQKVLDIGEETGIRFLQPA